MYTQQNTTAAVIPGRPGTRSSDARATLPVSGRAMLALACWLIVGACADSTTPTGPVSGGDEMILPGFGKGGGHRDKGHIVFVSNADNAGGNEIYSMNGDGTEETRLTFLGWSSLDPVLSPDGRRIAFSSRPPAGDTEIYVMNADGSDITRLTFSPGQDLLPTWSKDGGRIAFVSERDVDWEIYVMNADGSDPTRITYSPGRDWAPTWSPDGSRIAFSSDRLDPGSSEWEIYTMDPDGTRVTQVTHEHTFIEHISWHPKGRTLAFSNTEAIFIVSVDGTQLTQVVSTGHDGGWDPYWSPDGRRIAFTSDRDGGYHVYSMNPDGTAQTRLTTAWASYRATWGR